MIIFNILTTVILFVAFVIIFSMCVEWIRGVGK